MIGPSARAGMNVSAPTSNTTPTSSATNSGVCVGKRTRVACDLALGRETAGEREHRDHQPVTRDPHRDWERDVVERVIGGQSTERAAVVIAGGTEGIQDFGKPVRARVANLARGVRHGRSRSRCRATPWRSGIRSTSEAIFTSKASIFLPRYSGVRPTIRPATNTATMANMSIP